MYIYMYICIFVYMCMYVYAYIFYFLLLGMKKKLVKRGTRIREKKQVKEEQLKGEGKTESYCAPSSNNF